jgi:hypothetical protein
MKSEARKKKVKWFSMTDSQKQDWAMQIGDFLNTIYPGHLWAVAIEGGVAKVQDLTCSKTMGFQIKLSDIDTPDSFRKQLMLAGGEILERFNQPRGWLKPDAVLSAPRNIRGDMIHAK